MKLWHRDHPVFSRRRALISAAVVLITLLAAVGVAWNRGRLASGVVTVGDGIRVRVDIAATASTREQGLSGREALAPDQGMLFIFPRPDAYTFWMKDMRFPIDIIWIRGGEVADLTTDVPVPVPGQPLSVYSPASPADQVLEVSAGFAQAHGLRLGLPVSVSVDSRTAAR